MLVQIYDGHLTFALIIHTTANVGKGMYYDKQKHQKQSLQLSRGESKSTFGGKLYTIRPMELKS